jgi:hypothetical protein
MDLLVKKAWDLYRHTKTFPVETIHTATIWLEEKHRKTLNEKIAMAIALHDLLLAPVTTRVWNRRSRRNTAGERCAGKSKLAS